MNEINQSMNSELPNRDINRYDVDKINPVDSNIIEMTFLDESQKNIKKEESLFEKKDKKQKKNIVKSRQDFLDLSRLERKGETLKERLIRNNNENEIKEKELNSKFNIKDYFNNLKEKLSQYRFRKRRKKNKIYWRINSLY